MARSAGMMRWPNIAQQYVPYARHSHGEFLNRVIAYAGSHDDGSFVLVVKDGLCTFILVAAALGVHPVPRPGLREPKARQQNQ